MNYNRNHPNHKVILSAIARTIETGHILPNKNNNNNNNLFAQQNQSPIIGQKIKRNSNLSKSKSNSK
jgi:hypothetical protein